MECATMVVIERRWVVEQDFGDSILGYWARETRRRRRDFAGVEVWRRRASSCGGSDWCDRENGATSEVATGEKTGGLRLRGRARLFRGGGKAGRHWALQPGIR